MRVARGFSFAEVLVSLGILAMVLCGAMIFLQTNLMFYRKQIHGVRAAFVAQSLLTQVGTVPDKGRIEDLTFSAKADETGHWLHLQVGLGSLTYCEQTLWRLGSDRGLLYQDYDSQQWTLADSEGCSEQPISELDAVPVSDGQYLSWRGVQVYEGSTQDPQLDPGQSQIAFLRNGQVWVLNLVSKKASCWLGGPVQTMAWHDQNSLVVNDGSKILRVTARGQAETLYNGSLQQASVSPDLKQIVYVARPQETNDLCLYDRASRSNRVILATPEGEIRPLWSKDGLRILYGEAPMAGGTRLRCINADGSGLQDLGIVASANNWKWR